MEIFLGFLCYEILIIIFFGMATERTDRNDDLPGGVTPQASMKLSPPHWSPALHHRGSPPLPHQSSPVRATGMATGTAADMARNVSGPAPCGGRCWIHSTARRMSTPSSAE